jgi:hypothetical protein
LWANLHLLFSLSLISFATDGWASITCGRAFGLLWSGAVDVGDCALHFAASDHLFAGPRVRATEGDRERLEGENFPGDLCGGDCGAFRSGWIVQGLYALAALICFEPDRRIERAMEGKQAA